MMFKPRPKGLGKENFVKLADGAEVSGVFRGEIHTLQSHWVSGRGVECVGNGCQVCASGKEIKTRFRFRANFIFSVDGKYVAKIFEGGGKIYDQLANLEKKFNDLTKIRVDIMRIGSTRDDTSYTVMPRADLPITKEMEAEIAAVKLLALTAEVAPEPEKK